MKKNLTHQDRLKTVGESTRSVTDRISRTFNRATPSDIESGATWYADGGSFIDGLAQSTGQTRETVSAVVAHLSPRTRWARNVVGATLLLTTGTAPGCLRRNVSNAMRAMDSDTPLRTLNGPKSHRFARNLLGDRESVTIDVWALKVALGDREDADLILARVGMYAAIEYAYRLAARRAGVDPTTMQATTWIVARNGRAG